MNPDRRQGNWNPRTDVVSTFVIISSQSIGPFKGPIKPEIVHNETQC